MDFKTVTHHLFQTLDISYILKLWCALRKERLLFASRLSFSCDYDYTYNGVD